MNAEIHPVDRSAEERVRSLLRTAPLIDGHNDLPLVILNDEASKGDVRHYDLTSIHPESDTDIPRWKDGQIGMQVLAAFTDGRVENPAVRTLELIDVVRQIWERHPETVRPVLSASDIMDAMDEKKIGVMLAVEGGVGMEHSLAALRCWHGLGMRLMTLCHNKSLHWVDSATDSPVANGLSAFGADVIRELNRLGVIVDLSHVAPKAMHDVLDVSRAPVALSHSNASALCRSPRNVPDDVLDRIAGNGGIVMATFIPDFVSQAVLDWMAPVRTRFAATMGAAARSALLAEHEKDYGPRPRATLSEVCDHLDYFVDRVGIDHVGIGSDFHGGPVHTTGLEHIGRVRDILVELARRGWSDGDLAKVAGLNFIRVFEAVEKAGAAA